LNRPGDGRWYHEIELSEDLERAQWDDFEANFREAHEQSLPYRYLPSNDQEREVVVKAFPEVQFTEKKGTLTIDHEKVHHSTWEAPVRYSEMTNCVINEGTLVIQYSLEGKSKKQSINSGKYSKQGGELLAAFQNYYSRYVTAKAFQEQLATLEAQKKLES
jgi:hypothetical protein